MASLGNPRSWIPYMNRKDCSQGFCSLHCPQWCYIVYPPPPHPTFQYLDDDDSRPNFSPLVIAIIGILATAFLLVSYYALISKYCGRREDHADHHHPNDHELMMQEHHSPSLLHDEPSWHYASSTTTTGLDESLIKSITVCKYKRGDGLVVVTDCSVCLCEFEDDQSVRLLPKCSHAFHLPCIDTWLKSHSTCPLCRATIFTFNAASASPPPHQVPPATVTELPSSRQDETTSPSGRSGSEIGVVEEEEEESAHGADAAAATTSDAPEPALRAFSDLGNLQGRHRIIEIKDDEQVYESIGIRSVSMDHYSLQSGVSVVLVHMNQVVEGCSSSQAGPSKRSIRGERSKCSYKQRKVLHCVLSPIAMKRSFSGGGFSVSLTTSDSRGSQGIIPVREFSLFLLLCNFFDYLI